MIILKNFFYGLIMGIGFIIPGVSGGVLATILGIYDEIIERINHLFKNLKSNIIFLLPLFLGVILSILLFSNAILYLLNHKLDFISFVFIGLVLGCIPYLFKEIKQKTAKSISILPFLITFLFGVLLFYIETQNVENTTTPNIVIMIIAGFLYAIGKIVPGISGAALLMLLGVYEYFLGLLANPLTITIDIVIEFLPFIISFIISAFVIVKLISYLLSYHFRLTYSAIIGFVISSILFIYPGNFSFVSLIITILSFTISYYLSN